MAIQKPNSEARVLVVGAGVCGSVIAHTLGSTDARVTICDKGRGAGGRLSSRRSPVGRFNHGTPHFSVRDVEEFSEIEAWQRAGLVDVEEGAQSSLIRPTGPMNALVKHLQRDLEVLFNTRVVELSYSAGLWTAVTEGDPLGDFEHVVLALPAPQTRDLLPIDSPLRTSLDAITYDPAWVVMVSADAGQICTLEHPLIGQIESMEAGVCIHLTAQASKSYVEARADEVIHALGLDSVSPQYLSAHRWRYSQVTAFTEARLSIDQHTNLIVCGDGFGGAGVQAALRSGKAVAQHLIAALSRD